MSKQVILWRNKDTLSASATSYTGPASGQTWQAAEIDGTHPWAAAGEFSNLEVTLETAPGAGNSRSFTFRIGGVDTALTVTISDTATTAQLTGVSVSVAQWDKVTLASVPTSSPTAPGDITVSFDFDSTTPGEQCYGLASTANYAATVTNRVFFPSDGLNSTTSAQDIAAVDGVLGGYGVSLDRLIVTGTWTFVIFKNGVEQNGGGGTVDTRLVFTSASPQDQQVTFSLSVTAGDEFLYQVQETVSATAMSLSYGVLFTADTPGEFMLGASNNGNLSTTTTQYARLSGGNASAFAEPAETDVQAKVGVTPFTVSGLRVSLNGTGNSYVFTLRNNTAATALTATVTSTDASDLTNEVALVPGDLIAMEVDPVGTPTTRVAGWVVAANATPASTARSWGFVGAQAGMGFAA